MALSRSTELLAGLRDCLLTQVDAADADDVRDVVSRPGGGFVLVGEKALAKAQEFKRAGCDQPILADLRRYAGKRRVLGSAGFQQSWILAQQHLGLPAILTDSGYVGEDDTESLHTILSRAARLGPGTIATLPLHISWMERKRSQEHLIAAIDDAGLPVAFILEHARDPLAKKAALFGFVNVLRTVSVPVILLRCDVSALGGLAFGAHAAAIGTTTGLRHLYTPGGGGPPDGIESAFLREFLAFTKVGRSPKRLKPAPTIPCGSAGVSSARGDPLIGCSPRRSWRSADTVSNYWPTFETSSSRSPRDQPASRPGSRGALRRSSGMKTSTLSTSSGKRLQRSAVGGKSLTRQPQ